jgi:6,7-dimethyl-8-ribityllumazine synthase
MHLATDYAACIGNGILTVENDEQAWTRARMAEKDKGGGAAEAVLTLIAIRRKLGLTN